MKTSAFWLLVKPTRSIAISIAVLACFTFWNPAYPQNPDIDALQAVHVHRNQRLDPFFRGVSISATPVSVSTPLVLLGIGWLSKDQSIAKKGLYVLESMAVNTAISYSLKLSVNRPRPVEQYPFIDPYSVANTPSFPSGHTSNAFATATALTMAFPKWYVAAPAYAWAGTVAYSRLHLGSHYPSDVLIGAAIGAGSAWLSSKFNQLIFKTEKRPFEY